MAEYIYTIDEINIPDKDDIDSYTLDTYTSWVFENREDAQDYLLEIISEWMREYRLDADDISTDAKSYAFIEYEVSEARNCYLEATIRRKVIN